MSDALNPADLAGTYTIDPTHSTIGFVARHAMVTKVRGRFAEFEGGGVIDADFAKSTAHLTVQVKSVDTGNEQRDGHLRTNDFFAADEFPTITFTSTSLKLAGGNDVELTGDLTIRGVTHSVTVPFEFQGAATDPFGNQRVGFEGSTTIKRSDFGITWNAALETGGVLVSDKITLELELSAIKNV